MLSTRLKQRRRFQAPSDDERDAFRDSLRAELSMPVARRYSGGAAIHAACHHGDVFDLLHQARLSSLPFNELLQHYAMGRFMARLARSHHADRFVLKGGW